MKKSPAVNEKPTCQGRVTRKHPEGNRSLFGRRAFRCGRGRGCSGNVRVGRGQSQEAGKQAPLEPWQGLRCRGTRGGDGSFCPGQNRPQLVCTTDTVASLVLLARCKGDLETTEQPFGMSPDLQACGHRGQMGVCYELLLLDKSAWDQMSRGWEASHCKVRGWNRGAFEQMPLKGWHRTLCSRQELFLF